MLWRRGWWGPGDGWSETHQSWFWDADTNWSSSQTIHFQNADTAQHATVSASTEQWTLLELRTETTGIVQFCSIIAEFYKHAKSHWEFVNKKLLLLNHAAVTFKSTQYLYFLFSWIWSAGLYNRHSDDHCLVSGCPDDDVSTPDVSSWLLPDTVQISDSPHRPRHCRHHTLTDINAVVSSRAWFTHTVAVTSFQSK